MITKFATDNGLANYRIEQFNKQYYQNLIGSFSELTTWPKTLREKLIAEVDFSSLEFEKEVISAKGNTHKVLFKRKLDGQRIETVLMRHKDNRNTVCISCMVGCPVGCVFCATGKMGFGGNLTTKEIIDQVLYFQRLLNKSAQKLTNIVFMGMGEPMLNLVNVKEAISILTAENKLGFSQRRITISTSGYIPQFNQLVESGFRGRVAISLHAPNQELRAKLMPVAKIYPLDKLLAALDDYTLLTNKRVSYEYVLIKGVNDLDIHALQLVELFANRLAHINLIPYNPIKEESFVRTTKTQMDSFTGILDDYNMNYTIRVTMGDDVNAACGQLADRENTKHKDNKIKITI